MIETRARAGANRRLEASAQAPTGRRRRRDAPPTNPRSLTAPAAPTPNKRRRKQNPTTDFTTRKTKRNKARTSRRKANTAANSLKILQQNVAGLKTREVELFKRLERMNIDIAVIQECNFTVIEDNKTKKIIHEVPEYKGWNVVPSPRTTGRKEGSHSQGRGGVAILVREGINYESFKKRPVPDSDNTTEYAGVKIFPGDSKNQTIDIHNLYVPPINESSVDDDRVQN